MRPMPRNISCCLCDSTKDKIKVISNDVPFTLHLFPKNEELRSLWMKACNFEEETDISSFHVCSNHFTVGDYVDIKAHQFGGRIRLLRTVIPTQLLSKEEIANMERPKTPPTPFTSTETHLNDCDSKEFFENVLVDEVLIKDETSDDDVIHNVEKPDLNGTCRICLSIATDLVNLFSANPMFENVTVSTAIDKCFGVLMYQDDDLPSCVCFQCFSQVLQACTFKQCILKGEETLNELKSSITNDHCDNKNTVFVIPPTADQNFIAIEKIDPLMPEMKINTPLAINKDVHDDVDNLDQQLLKSDGTSKYNSTQLNKWWSKRCGPPYKCKLCDLNYGNCYTSFYRHVRTHHMSKVLCIHCGKMYKKDFLRKHMHSHTNDRPFICGQCPARFNFSENLQQHTRNHCTRGKRRSGSVVECLPST